MAAAYGRVVALHLTIIFGTIAAAFLGAPIGALLVLVALKTALDLGLHLRDRSRADLALSKAAAGAMSASVPPIPSAPPVPSGPPAPGASNPA